MSVRTAVWLRRQVAALATCSCLLVGPPPAESMGQRPPAACTPENRSGLPAWFVGWFEAKGPHTRFDVACYLTPFYLRGNFDGRGQLDCAVLIVERRTGKRGVLVVHRPGYAYFVLGAGSEFGNGGDDFDWMDVWQVTAAPRSDRGRPLAGVVGEALELIKSESASGYVGWNGRRYVWVQGDD